MIQRIRRVDSVIASGSGGGSNGGVAARGSASSRAGAGRLSESARVAMTLRATGITATEPLPRGESFHLGKKDAAFGTADHGARRLLGLRCPPLAFGTARLGDVHEPHHEEGHEDDDDPENDLAHRIS